MLNLHCLMLANCSADNVLTGMRALRDCLFDLFERTFF